MTDIREHPILATVPAAPAMAPEHPVPAKRAEPAALAARAPTPLSPGRVVGLDGTRGLAALFVVLALLAVNLA